MIDIEVGAEDVAPKVTAPVPVAIVQDESLALTVTVKFSPVAKDAGLLKPQIAKTKVGLALKELVEVPVTGAFIVKVESCTG